MGARGLTAQAWVIRKLEEALNIEMLMWWVNLYEDGGVGCEFHHDGHGQINNITVGASFGATRDLTFQHRETGEEVSFMQQNGDIFAFDDFIDSNYMHGLYPTSEKVGPRISVIIMSRTRKSSNQAQMCPLSDWAHMTRGVTSGHPCGKCT